VGSVSLLFVQGSLWSVISMTQTAATQNPLPGPRQSSASRAQPKCATKELNTATISKDSLEMAIDQLQEECDQHEAKEKRITADGGSQILISWHGGRKQGLQLALTKIRRFLPEAM